MDRDVPGIAGMRTLRSSSVSTSCDRYNRNKLNGKPLLSAKFCAAGNSVAGDSEIPATY
jgi:hypothetical protein